VQEGFTKIALGHHADDLMETLFLNMFFGGKLKSMPPKLVSDDGRNIVIRPLAYCRERDIERYARARAFPLIPCNLCGTQENLRRQDIKAMIAGWENKYPQRVQSILASLGNVVPAHLMDRGLHDFAAMKRPDKKTGPADADPVISTRSLAI
jgi:tRNA 2-thiocytidine biosynthesis protein TtcA